MEAVNTNAPVQPHVGVLTPAGGDGGSTVPGGTPECMRSTEFTSQDPNKSDEPVFISESIPCTVDLQL